MSLMDVPRATPRLRAFALKFTAAEKAAEATAVFRVRSLQSVVFTAVITANGCWLVARVCTEVHCSRSGGRRHGRVQDGNFIMRVVAVLVCAPSSCIWSFACF